MADVSNERKLWREFKSKHPEVEKARGFQINFGPLMDQVVKDYEDAKTDRDAAKKAVGQYVERLRRIAMHVELLSQCYQTNDAAVKLAASKLEGAKKDQLLKDWAPLGNKKEYMGGGVVISNGKADQLSKIDFS